MIADIANALQAAFTARKFPTTFSYGTVRFAVDAFADHLVIIERDRDGNADNMSPVSGAQQNPRRLANRSLAAKATIYAQSRLDGARPEEHEAECEQIVDGLITCLADWGTANLARLGGVGPTLGEMRYLKSAEFHPDAETWPGVVYLLRFRVNRAVIVRDYEGAARPTGTAAHVGNTIEVRRAPTATPEIITLP